jgi:para-nitrobenzyl esterase
MRLRLQFALAACFASATACVVEAPTEPDGGIVPDADGDPTRPIVATSTGALEGRVEDGVARFLGIPYAEPPLGDARWRAPSPAAPWSGVRRAVEHGPVCPQRDETGDVVGSEDCLSLNVYVRTDALFGTAPPRPVMVWIHGGGFEAGSASIPWYDGGELASRADVLVVSIQYRLGILGFVALAEMIDEGGTAGNFGILDQQLALSWIAREIAVFGGDPSRITVFGESAGGASGCTLLASPRTPADAMHGVIMQSGECLSRPLEAALADGERLVEPLECGTAGRLACLRALDAPALVAASPSYLEVVDGRPTRPYVPVEDGHVLDAPTREAMAGARPDVPVIIGSTAEEMYLYHAVITEELASSMANDNGVSWAAVREHYQRQYPWSPFLLYTLKPHWLLMMATDFVYSCPHAVDARARSDGADAPVYRYVFEHQPELAPAAHSVDVPYTLQTRAANPYYFLMDRDIDRDVEAQMLARWVAFATTGDPNVVGYPDWPAFEAGSERYLPIRADEAPPGGRYRGVECPILGFP